MCCSLAYKGLQWLINCCGIKIAKHCQMCCDWKIIHFFFFNSPVTELTVHVNVNFFFKENSTTKNPLKNINRQLAKSYCKNKKPKKKKKTQIIVTRFKNDET